MSLEVIGWSNDALKIRGVLTSARVSRNNRLYLPEELRDSSDGSIMGSTLLATATVTIYTAGAGGAQNFFASLQVPAQEGRYYSFVFYVQNNGGDASNYYHFNARGTARALGAIAAHY